LCEVFIRLVKSNGVKVLCRSRQSVCSVSVCAYVYVYKCIAYFYDCSCS